MGDIVFANLWDEKIDDSSDKYRPPLPVYIEPNPQLLNERTLQDAGSHNCAE